MNGENTHGNSVLKLKKGDAYKIKVEEPKDMGDSPFKSVYLEAIAAFKEIDNDNQTKYRDQKEKLATQNVDRLPEFNNVIAFCGERGSGKTSAMVSFRNLLDGWGTSEVRKSSIGERLEADAKTATKFHFLCLDTVDPSRFEPHDRLIGSILSELYRRFDHMISDNCDTKNHDKQRKVEAAFREVHEAVQLLSNTHAQPFGTPGAGENPFDILRRAGKAASMRELVHTLVRAFLDFAPIGDDANKYLVIPVDDLDMSVQHAYVLAEDIRKYFLIPNVIVLLAAKLDQLRMAVEQSYVAKFENYMKRLQKPSADEIESMSNLYLEKLVPLGRRINMPDLSKGDFIKLQRATWEGREGNLEQLILNIIYEQTQLIFLPITHHVHPIVPTTLREVHNFLAYLDPPEFNKENKNREGNDRQVRTKLQKKESLQWFKAYFINEWVPRNFGREEEDLISQIDQARVSEKTWLIAQIVGRRLGLVGKGYDLYDPEATRNLEALDHPRKFDYIKEIKRIVNPETPRNHVSIGDIRLLLRRLEAGEYWLSGGLLAFAIRTLLTMELLQMLFSDSYDEEVFASFVNGSFVNPLESTIKLGSLIAKGVPKIYDEKNLRFSLSKVQLTTDSDSGKVSAIRFIESKCKAAVKGRIDTLNHRQLFSLVGNWLYFGDFENLSKDEYEESPWYNFVSPIFDQGRKTEYVSFDFEAFLFWLLVPQMSIDRINFKNRLNPVYGTIKESESEVLAFWETLLQLEILEVFRDELRKNYFYESKAGYFSESKANEESDEEEKGFRLHKAFSFMIDQMHIFWDNCISKIKDAPRTIPQELKLFDRNSQHYEFISQVFTSLDDAMREYAMSEKPKEIGAKLELDEYGRLATFLQKFKSYELNPRARDMIRDTVVQFRRFFEAKLTEDQKEQITTAFNEFGRDPRILESRSRLAKVVGQICNYLLAGNQEQDSQSDAGFDN